MDRSKLNEVAEAALEAFWAEVAAQFPEIKTGDESPTSKFEEEAKEAIKEWHRNNS